MKRHDLGAAVLILLACLPLGACSHTMPTNSDEDIQPARVEHLKGSEPTRITLTADAARRLDIHSEEVRGVKIHGVSRIVIPYGAVLYDTEGNTWAYTTSEPLVFVRHRITVDYIDGDLAVLSAGPPVGLKVVTIGGEELYGSELEFEEE